MQENKSTKKIIIIGAGISGLSAGVFGQKYGYQTEIFEKNPIEGGLCMSWSRKGHLIDGCIHWMTGTKPNGGMRAVWDELHAFTDEEIIRDDNFGAFDYNGTTIVFWNDIEKLKKELLEISPEDKTLINKLIKYFRNIMSIRVPIELPVSLMKPRDILPIGINLLPRLGTYIKCTKTQLCDFANKFKSPAIRFGLSNLIPGNTNIYSALYSYGTNVYGNGGVLKGGSLTLVKNISNYYKELGGVIHYNSTIKSIIIENNKAIGIELTNGEKHYADYIITAISPYNVMEFIPSSYKLPEYSKRDNNPRYHAASGVMVSLAIDKEAKDALNLHYSTEFNTTEFVVAKQKLSSIKIKDYSYDECFVKNGKSTCQVLIQQYWEDMEYWNSFKSYNEYCAKKKEIADTVVKLIIEKYPSLEGKIEILDVATPHTLYKYTGAYKGSYQPFMFTSKSGMLTHKGRINGLKNLFLASQWVLTPGGLPPAMLAGKYSIQQILKREHRNYRITKKGGTL